MSTIGYFITCDDANCTDCYPGLDAWLAAGGFEGWTEPIEIHDDSEHDTPTHCTECKVVIEHALTDDGARYVCEAIEQCFREGKRSEVVEQWIDAYSDDLPDDHYVTPLAIDKGGNEVHTGDLIELFLLLPLREQRDPLALAAEVAVELARLDASDRTPPPGGWRSRAIETVAARHQMNPYELDRIVRGEG